MKPWLGLVRQKSLGTSGAFACNLVLKGMVTLGALGTHGGPALIVVGCYQLIAKPTCGRPRGDNVVRAKVLLPITEVWQRPRFTGRPLLAQSNCHSSQPCHLRGVHGQF